MSVVVVGLEQHQAPLELLERVAIPEAELDKPLAALRARANLTEVVVLSTCLRTELYAVVERFHDGVADLQDFLAARAGSSVEALAEHLTVLYDDAVALHLFEVAAGLRSAVLGESEVLGQVRRAGERAAAEGASGPVLGALFRRAVQAGRRVRTDTGIARGSTSLSHVAVELAASRMGGTLAERSVLVVGAGEMAEGIVAALAAQSPSPPRVVVANRTPGRAKALAARAGGSVVDLDGLPRALADADAVLVSTGAAVAVLGADLLVPALASRAGRARGLPLVVVDLGVPRNVDPAVRALGGIELYDMDDLRAHAERAMAGRRGEVARAEAIVREELERHRVESRARGAAPVVAALRGRVDEIRRAELERLRGRRGLSDAQWQAVADATADVLAKVLHQPTIVLKEAAGTPRGERLTEALRTLFGL